MMMVDHNELITPYRRKIGGFSISSVKAYIQSLNVKRFWNKMFRNEKDCRNYVEGVCLHRVMDELFKHANHEQLVCEMCNEFETILDYIDRKIKEEVVKRGSKNK